MIETPLTPMVETSTRIVLWNYTFVKFGIMEKKIENRFKIFC